MPQNFQQPRLARDDAPDDEDVRFEHLVNELVELRRACAEALGRRQYVYELLDQAAESGHSPTMQQALREFDLLDDEVRERVIVAAGMTS